LSFFSTEFVKFLTKTEQKKQKRGEGKITYIVAAHFRVLFLYLASYPDLT